jgi:hypothetical protein
MHTSECESSESEGGEAAALQNCSYVELHALHANRGGRGHGSGKDRGATRATASSFAVEARDNNIVRGGWVARRFHYQVAGLVDGGGEHRGAMAGLAPRAVGSLGGVS